MKNQIEGIVADWIIHHYCNTGGTKNNYNKIASAITDLFKEKMLEYVGEDMEHREIKEVGRWYSYTEKNYYPCDELINYGSNKAKDEIRKKVRGL